MVPPRLSLIWHDSAEGCACGDRALTSARYSATTGIVVLRSEGMICARMMPRALGPRSRCTASLLTTEKP